MNKMKNECIIVEESLNHLSEYALIPISFEVRSIFEVSCDNPDLAVLEEKPVKNPWIKNYDKGKDAGPTSWPGRWDISNWGMLTAYVQAQRVAGTVLAYDTCDIDMLEERNDLAVIWDLRVHPDHRGNGIGNMLFDAAVVWARERHCKELKIETQNINVPACRFYKRMGCQLSSIERFVYNEFLTEIKLVWTLGL